MHDEELEHSEQRTRDLLDDEVYHEALSRATAVANGRGQAVDPDSLAGEFLRPDALAQTLAGHCISCVTTHYFIKVVPSTKPIH
jgi:hypothetical protein